MCSNLQTCTHTYIHMYLCIYLHTCVCMYVGIYVLMHAWMFKCYSLTLMQSFLSHHTFLQLLQIVKFSTSSCILQFISAWNGNKVHWSDFTSRLYDTCFLMIDLTWKHIFNNEDWLQRCSLLPKKNSFCIRNFFALKYFSGFFSYNILKANMVTCCVNYQIACKSEWYPVFFFFEKSSSLNFLLTSHTEHALTQFVRIF